MTLDEDIAAASATATLFAGLVALAVPFVLDWRQRSRERAERGRQRDASFREVCFGVEKALWAFIRLRRLIDTHEAEGGHSGRNYRRHAREAEAAALVLERLLNRPELTDTVLRCGLEGLLLAEESNEAAEIVLDELERGIWECGHAAIHASDERAQEALSKVQSVRTFYKLRRTVDAPPPVLD